MDSPGPSSEQEGWFGRLLATLLGRDAEWVLGDLEERRGKRRGPGRALATVRDLLSVACWKLTRGRIRRRVIRADRGGRRAKVGAFADELWQDLRSAKAGLRHDAGFAITTVLVLAVGIGLNTAVYSALHSTLLEPLPYPDSDRLVVLWTDIPSQGMDEATSAYANVQDWRGQSRVFTDLATFDPTSLTLLGGEWPEQVSAAWVSANLFPLLGVAPRMGRTFSLDEERRGAPVAVVSHRFWEGRFAASSAVIGRTIEVADMPLRIIGVMPDDFAFPGSETQLWLPQTLLGDWDAVSERRGTDAWRVVGRLAPSVPLERARSEMNRVAADLEGRYSANAGLGVNVVPLLDQVTGASFRLTLWTLFGAVGLVLLLACANAAHLLLARSTKRAQDISLRLALGATRLRLIRQTLTESLLLSLGAGMAGLGLAIGALRVLTAVGPENLPRLQEITLEPEVLGYVTLVCAATAVFLGIVPALIPARALYGSLREASTPLHGRRTLRVRAVLIAFQFAVAILLVFGANLLTRSWIEARRVDPGFRSENVLMANLSFPSPSGRTEFYDEVIRSVAAIPGGRAVGAVEDLFISGAPNWPITVEGRVEADPSREEVRFDAVAGDFFRAIGAPLREGRLFSEEDGGNTPGVAIINETMAARLWPGQTPVGRRFRIGGGESEAAWIEVVGVVADMLRQGPERQPIAQAFRPYVQAPSRNMNLLVRGDTSVADLTAAIRTTVAAIDPTVPLYQVTTVERGLDRYLLERRFQTFVMGLFSVIALTLAAVGVFGLLQYSVAQRTGEIGLRMALGADRRNLVGMILRQGLAMVLPGLVIGVACAVILSEAVSALLFGVTASDPTATLSTSGLLLVTALLACYLPARRGARTDPMSILRHS